MSGTLVGRRSLHHSYRGDTRVTDEFPSLLSHARQQPLRRQRSGDLIAVVRMGSWDRLSGHSADHVVIPVGGGGASVISIALMGQQPSGGQVRGRICR